MKLSGRSVALWLGGLALLAAGGAWLASATEWASRNVWDPPEGEAASDPYFLIKQLANRVGAKVETRHQLDVLPPRGATLLLEAGHWHFLPEREAALHRWVEGGGHLVAYRLVADDPAITDWVPVSFASAPRRKAEAASAAASGASASASARGQADSDEDERNEDTDDEAFDDEDSEAMADDGAEAPVAPPAVPPATSAASVPPMAVSKTAEPGRREKTCPPLAEPAGHAGWFGAPRSYQSCARGEPILRTKTTPTWSVSDDKGLRAIRLAVGHGTVTLSSQWSAPKFDRLQEDEDALLWAAVVQLRPGQLIWVVDDEQHPGLFATLWSAAPVACVLAALAVLLMLWRGATRFAPLRAADVLARRSMTQQVRGTAAYLLRHGPAALHRAQWRALDETAHAHLPGWRRLPPGRRATVLARHADLPPTDMEKACDLAAAREPAAIGRALALMEAARRRIAELDRETAAPRQSRLPHRPPEFPERPAP